MYNHLAIFKKSFVIYQPLAKSSGECICPKLCHYFTTFLLNWLYPLSWGFDWLGRRPMKPDLLGGLGPGEEDSGLLHGGSMRMTENEEMGKGGDSETDLERKDQKKKVKPQKIIICSCSL